MFVTDTEEVPELLPAFFFGFKLGADSTIATNDAPPWLLLLEHTVGGVAMTYPTLLGVVLRLGANLERGVGQPADVMRAFVSQDYALLRRDFPALAPLLLGTDGSYRQAALHTLGSFLQRHFHLPDLVEGQEALVQFEVTDPLAWFRGWRVFSRHEVESRVVSHDEERFEAPLLDALIAFARQHQVPGRPRLFFLWENSD